MGEEDIVIARSRTGMYAVDGLNNSTPLNVFEEIVSASFHGLVGAGSIS